MRSQPLAIHVRRWRCYRIRKSAEDIDEETAAKPAPKGVTVPLDEVSAMIRHTHATCYNTIQGKTVRTHILLIGARNTRICQMSLGRGHDARDARAVHARCHNRVRRMYYWPKEKDRGANLTSSQADARIQEPYRNLSRAALREMITATMGRINNIQSVTL